LDRGYRVGTYAAKVHGRQAWLRVVKVHGRQVWVRVVKVHGRQVWVRVVKVRGRQVRVRMVKIRRWRYGCVWRRFVGGRCVPVAKVRGWQASANVETVRSNTGGEWLLQCCNNHRLEVAVAAVAA
jgi:hypothetical protein